MAKNSAETAKTFWITGASTGIGAALATACIQAGHKVMGSARRLDKLQQLGDTLGSNFTALPLDVTDYNAVRQLIHDHPLPDVVVLNAGGYMADNATNFSASNLKYHLDLNVMGIANALEHLLPAMFKRGSGQIALVASVAGYRGLPNGASYCSSKAAVIALAESLRFDCMKAGIKLQVINPGFVETPLTDKNTFKMPFIIPAEKAAKVMLAGLESDQFEICFPKRFAYGLKFLGILPDALYFKAMQKLTGL